MDMLLILGAGVGTAGFCAAARLPGISVTLVELDHAVLDLARDGLKDPAQCPFCQPGNYSGSRHHRQGQRAPQRRSDIQFC